jgi:hypothetical protein
MIFLKFGIDVLTKGYKTAIFVKIGSVTVVLLLQAQFDFCLYSPRLPCQHAFLSVLPTAALSARISVCTPHGCPVSTHFDT